MTTSQSLASIAKALFSLGPKHSMRGVAVGAGGAGGLGVKGGAERALARLGVSRSRD